MLVQLSLHFDRSPADISIAEVKEYLYYSRQERYLSNAFINQTISAVKILKQDILGEKWEGALEIKRPRRSCHLPRILSVEEVKLMLEVTKNLKHKSILSVLYSSGIRLSELLSLRLGDIDSKRMLIRVTDGKGQKSRDTILSVKTLALLRSYYRKIDPKPKVYLFESVEAGKAYSATSVRKIVKRAARKAGIKKNIFPHSLRHAFATHLLEQGNNIKMIQKLLGHNQLRSTMVYLHVMAIDPTIKSPMDQL